MTGAAADVLPSGSGAGTQGSHLEVPREPSLSTSSPKAIGLNSTRSRLMGSQAGALCLGSAHTFRADLARAIALRQPTVLQTQLHTSPLIVAGIRGMAASTHCRAGGGGWMPGSLGGGSHGPAPSAELRLLAE